MNHSAFLTKSPFGKISFDQSSIFGRIYEIRQNEVIQHKTPTWVWSLHVRPDHALNLTVTSFQLTCSGEDCSADYMTMSEPDRVIGHYCGNKLPWSVESCSNRMDISMGLVSPGHVVVRILYQVTDKPPAKCPVIPVIHNTAKSGLFIIRHPSYLDNYLFHKYSISWYIIVDWLKRISLEVHNFPFVMVYHGRFAKNMLRANPHSVQQGEAQYEIIGFHALIVMEFLDSHVQKIKIQYHVINNTVTASAEYCRYVASNSTKKTMHIEAKAPRVDYSGKEPRTAPLYCFLRFKTDMSLRIEIEQIQFASNVSEDCLDNGLIIYDEYQEVLEVFNPQIGPLCGSEMARRLQVTPQRIINTVGTGCYKNNFGKWVWHNVYIVFYSYAEDDAFFKANIAHDINCVGLFQPCSHVGTLPEGHRERVISSLSLMFQYLITEKYHKVTIQLFVDIPMQLCLVFQFFPVPRKQVTACAIHINSGVIKDTKRSKYSFLDPVKTELYYSTGANMWCVGCYDRLVPTMVQMWHTNTPSQRYVFVCIIPIRHKLTLLHKDVFLCIKGTKTSTIIHTKKYWTHKTLHTQNRY